MSITPVPPLTRPALPGYVLVDGNILEIVGNQISDQLPDIIGMTGVTVTFTYGAPYIVDPTSHSILPAAPVVCSVASVDGSVTNNTGATVTYYAGQLLYPEGLPGVYLAWDPDRPDATWGIAISGVPGQATIKGSLPASVVSGDLVYLDEMIPLPASSGTPMVRGPVGPPPTTRGDWNDATAYDIGDIVLGSDGYLYA